MTCEREKIVYHFLYKLLLRTLNYFWMYCRWNRTVSYPFFIRIYLFAPLSRSLQIYYVIENKKSFPFISLFVLFNQHIWYFITFHVMIAWNKKMCIYVSSAAGWLALDCRGECRMCHPTVSQSFLAHIYFSRRFTTPIKCHSVYNT